MKSVAGKVIFAALSVLYPALVFCGLVFWDISPRRLSLLLIGLAFVLFFNTTQGKKGADTSGSPAANGVKDYALIVLMLRRRFLLCRQPPVPGILPGAGEPLAACVFWLFPVEKAQFRLPHGMPWEPEPFAIAGTPFCGTLLRPGDFCLVFLFRV